jgi:cytochrome c5
LANSGFSHKRVAARAFGDFSPVGRYNRRLFQRTRYFEDAMSDNSHDEAHTGPIKTPKQLLVTVFFSFVAPVFIIIGLVYYVTSAFIPQAGVVDTAKQTAQRIQKVGMVEVKDANRALKSGEEVYKAQCTACHAAGVAGAPKFGDVAAWAPRLKLGLDALLTSAMKGKGAMGAQAGGDFEDGEIANAVVYMANGSGGKFEAPKAIPPAK